MSGVQLVVFDDHSGLKAARKAVFGGAVWQRYQFHLAQNAIHHTPSQKICKRIGAELSKVWKELNLTTATENLLFLVKSYHEKTPYLAKWLENKWVAAEKRYIKWELQDD